MIFIMEPQSLYAHTVLWLTQEAVDEQSSYGGNKYVPKVRGRALAVLHRQPRPIVYNHKLIQGDKTPHTTSAYAL
jgi:hypothetical protein